MRAKRTIAVLTAVITAVLGLSPATAGTASGVWLGRSGPV
jgi:hypothetical protein